MGCIGLLVASLAALLGSFLTITTVNLDALGPWFETLGTRPMGPAPVPSPTALVTPPLWEVIPQLNLTLTFSDPFVSPETAPPTPPPFAFVLEEEDDDWADFAEESATEELFRQLGHFWLLVRRTVLVLLVNFKGFQVMHPHVGCEKQFEKPSGPHPGRLLRRLRRRLVSRRPARRALGRAVFGLPSGPLPFLAPVVAPPAPSPSLPSMPEWPASPPYPLAAFIEKIRDLQNEVKDLNGELEELRRRQSPADQPVASGSSGAQPALVAGTAPLQPTDNNGKCEYSFRFAPPLAAAAPVVPAAIRPIATPSSKPPRTQTDLKNGGSDFTFRFSAPAPPPPPPPQTSLLTSWTEASQPKKPFLSDFFENLARDGAAKSDGEDA